MMKTVNRQGFTLVELLIALAFFSFLLMALTVGFIQINRAFTKGITVKTIQENGRVLIEDISRAIRSKGNDDITIMGPPNNYRLCIGNTRYAWNQSINTGGTRWNEYFAVTTSPLVYTTVPINLVKTGSGSCGDPITQSRAETIIDKRAIVQHLEITPIGGGAYGVKLILSTENSSDLSQFGSDAKCLEQVGNQFCDVVRYETVVSVRN